MAKLQEVPSESTSTAPVPEPEMPAPISNIPVPEIAPAKINAAKLFEFACNMWLLTAPPGCQPEHLDGHPTYWSALKDLREADHIHVVAHDRSWHAMFICVHAQGGLLRCRLAFKVAGSRPSDVTGPAPVPAGYTIERLPPNHDLGDGYVVRRLKDDFVISNSGRPWPDYQSCYEAFRGHAIHRDPTAVRYYS